MTYVGRRPRGGLDWYFERLQKQLDAYPDNYLIPQIGLSMTSDGSPEQHYENRVAAGDSDAETKGFCEGLPISSVADGTAIA
jgi:hypothetical protein